MPLRIADVVFAPDDLGDAHGGVVDDHGEVIQRIVNRAGNNEILKLGSIKGNLASYFVGESNAAPRIPQPHDLDLFFRLFSTFFAGEIRAILFYEHMQRLAVDIGSLRLPVELIPGKTEPGETCYLFLLVLFGAALLVGILDTQNESAFVVFREKIIEQGGACRTNVEIP